MLTRSEAAHVRLAALETVFNLVTSLREEYLQLLPETLPFLAELLEDPDRGVEVRAREALKELEVLADEDLSGYMRP